MSKPTLMGTCTLCGISFSRAAMTRHLKTCGVPDPHQPSNPSFHLFVEARYNKMYWMHLAVPVNVTLDRVDAFLRHTWLECCGHLSGFTIKGQSYVSDVSDEFDDSGMEVRLSRILQPGMKFSYEYDYGSTTELNLKVQGFKDRRKQRGAVELLARNDAPAFDCELCGKHPATQICTVCVYKGHGWLCKSCSKSHECGFDMCLPIVNSPRTGVCAYTG